MPSLDAAGSLFFFVLLGAPVLAAIALVVAHRRYQAHFADYALLGVPALGFVFVGFAREELRTGWALVLWPILIAALCMYLFALKVLVVNPRLEQTNRASLLLFAVIAIVSLVLALSVPPLLE